MSEKLNLLEVNTMDTISEKNLSEKKIFKVAALLSYLIGFFYVEFYFYNRCRIGKELDLGYIIFAALFIGGVELFSNMLGVTYKSLKEQGKNAVEPIVFAACVLLQSASYIVIDYHDDIQFYQAVMWHFTIIYYVLSRTGTLAAGRSGILFPLDAFNGCVTVPFMNFFLNWKCIFKKKKKAAAENAVIYQQDQMAYQQAVNYTQGQPVGGLQGQPVNNVQGQVVNYPQSNPVDPKAAKRATIIASVIIALIVCMIAWAQLVDASTTFGNLGDELGKFLSRIFSLDFFDYFFRHIFPVVFWSIPVTLWLFGLVGGSLKEKKPYCTDASFEEQTKTFHLLPSYSAYIIIGSICGIYLLFVISSFVDMYTNQGIFAATAHAACVNALECFWALIRVVVLNFTLIIASCLFSKKALWTETATRLLTTVLLIFGILFAGLAAWALCGIYAGVYGWTARRVLSSWVVFVIAVWSVLALIRLYKKIPAAQIAVVLAAASFSALMCFQF
jgi:hypothetical protein